MPRAYVVDTQVEDSGRIRVQAILQWGGAESLNPRDVGLRTIDSIVLSPQAIRTTAQPLPIGSVQAHFLTAEGTPGGGGKITGGGIGSTALLRWAQGSTGTRLASAQTLGSASPGTKTAHAWIFGT